MNLKTFCELNWFKLKEKIDYNWDRYWNWTVSVTSILKLIEDPKFDAILSMYPERVQARADKWTEEHSKAELFFKPKSWVTEMNPNFMKFHTLFWIEPLKHEERVEKDNVSWTIDLIWRITMWINKWTYNIDYKNSDKHSIKYELQLMWYKWLNWNDWVLVYWKWKLKVIYPNPELYDIWIQLKDYFFKLLNDAN